MGSIYRKRSDRVNPSEEEKCIRVSSEVPTCIDISSFVPRCIDIFSNINDEGYGGEYYNPRDEDEHLDITDTPILSSTEVCVADGDIIGVQIDNFSPTATYVNLSSAPFTSAYLLDDTIVWEFTNIDCDESKKVAIQAIEPNKLVSEIGDYEVKGKCQFEKPILSGATQAPENTTVEVTIANYDASLAYDITTDARSATMLDGVISVDLPYVSNPAGEYFTVEVFVIGEECKLDSSVASHVILATDEIQACVEPTIDPIQLVFPKGGGTIVQTILNYREDGVYTASATSPSAGEITVSISGDKVTWNCGVEGYQFQVGAYTAYIHFEGEDGCSQTKVFNYYYWIL